jgi:release factor glutamine methyltransferase
MVSKAWHIREILEVTSEYLKEKRIDSPRLTAEILLSHQLNIERINLYLNYDKPLTKEEVDGYRSLIKRRVKHEPVQYITGEQEFWSLDFHVNPSVLVPRPESEMLIEIALDNATHINGFNEGKGRVLDLGTGSGALAVCIAHEMPSALIWATDISPAALEIARLNAERHGVSDKIKFFLGDLWEPVMGEGLSFDLILSNPPYVSDDEYPSLPLEVRDHEPRFALCGHSDGMYYIEKIIAEAWKYLNPGGCLVMEMAPGQTERALGLLVRQGAYECIDRVKDYTRSYRLVTARRTGLNIAEDQVKDP